MKSVSKAISDPFSGSSKRVEMLSAYTEGYWTVLEGASQKMWRDILKHIGMIILMEVLMTIVNSEKVRKQGNTNKEKSDKEKD